MRSNDVDGAATSAQLRAPTSVAVDGLGNVFVADTANNRVRRVDITGVITTVAGTGTSGFSGDNGLATAAQLSAPAYVLLDGSGNLYISDSGNHRVRRVSASGVITTIAGTGVVGSGGDGGLATSATVHAPTGLALDGLGNLYVADSVAQRIRRIATNGVITTVAGTGSPGFSGDGGPAVNAELYDPSYSPPA